MDYDVVKADVERIVKGLHAGLRLRVVITAEPVVLHAARRSPRVPVRGG